MTEEVSKCTVCLEKDATFLNFDCQHKVLCDDCSKETFRQRSTEVLRCNVCRKEVRVTQGPDSVRIGTTESVSIVYGYVKKTKPISDEDKNLYSLLAPTTVRNVYRALEHLYTILGYERAVETLEKLEKFLTLVEHGTILNDEQATILYAVWDYVTKAKKDLCENSQRPLQILA